MKHITFLQYYLKFIYENDTFDIEEMKKEIMKDSTTKPNWEGLRHLKSKSMLFAEAIMEVVNNIRENPVEVVDFSNPETLTAIEIQERLGIDKSTFSTWRKDYGFFEKWVGSTRKREYYFKDLEVFFDKHPKGEKYKKLWFKE